eukprot:365375-Pyramimonas_sp.AAC.1
MLPAHGASVIYRSATLSGARQYPKPRSCQEHNTDFHIANDWQHHKNGPSAQGLTRGWADKMT